MCVPDQNNICAISGLPIIKYDQFGSWCARECSRQEYILRGPLPGNPLETGSTFNQFPKKPQTPNSKGADAYLKKMEDFIEVVYKEFQQGTLEVWLLRNWDMDYEL